MTHSCPTRRSADLGTTAIACIDHSPQVFVAPSGWAKDRVDFIIQDRWPVRLIGDLPQNVRRRRVYRQKRVWNQHRCNLQHPRLSASRSEEHTSELQSLMRISYAVFCLKNKK